MPTQFDALFKDYLAEAANARRRDSAERQLSHLFITFLHDAFGVPAKDIVHEQHVQLAAVERDGYIDALVGNLVFEFKRDLKTGTSLERGKDQLRGYLASLGGGRYTGLLTDGLKFEVYSLNDGRFEQADSFNLAELDADSAFIRLDAYLFSRTNTPPTAADIVGRFGGGSPTFRAVFRGLTDLLARVNDVPMLGVWREQWRKLLSKVYGSDVGSDDLFLRHTYLCQFAKLLAYAALRGLPDSDSEVTRILSGDAFNAQGVSNIGERDFFSWILMDEIKDDAVHLWRRLAEGLVVYDLSRIDQDLLKQLYQNLVDPATRHDLGEFYTPDWLAELTLESIDYRPGQSLLDPACGSGSFLFAAVQRLAAGGLTGWPLVDFTVNHIAGMDVHPLAVTVARVNLLLALAEHMQAPRPGGSALITLPVYMADALLRPLEGRGADALVVTVDERGDEHFKIPVASAAQPGALSSVIDAMYQAASRSRQPDAAAFVRLAESRFGALDEAARAHWRANLLLLARLIHDGRNGIWTYILNNLSRPLALAERKFDVVAGNPPWLSYRYIKNRAYQREVKALYVHYRLIDSGDVKLFTQMDLSTLFFAHARDRYLRPDGTLAFVMPRAVITGAKQHRPFQAGGHIRRAVDLLGVEPLFNVPTCVLVHTPGEAADGEAGIPTLHYSGRLPSHELALTTARPLLQRRETRVTFVDSDIRSPHYRERFVQGATLVPRNLCFVVPEGNPNSPALMTDPEADREAKAPYKGVTLRGVVDDDYLYATLLSKHLLPFGFEKLHLVALPFALDGDGRLRLMTQRDFDGRGHYGAADWFKAAAERWDALKKETTKMTLAERYDYQRTLTCQTPRGSLRVVYNGSGVHLAACVVNAGTARPDPARYGRRGQGFVVDHKTYYCVPDTAEEAHYLCALLNAACLDSAIKAYQSRGKGFVGERDIHRAPFEAAAIPPFSPAQADHVELARLSVEAHAAVAMLKTGGGLSGGVVMMRRRARAAAAAQLDTIERLARRVLGL